MSSIRFKNLVRAESHRAPYHVIAIRGQCAYMARYLLRAGFRVILLDLPGVSIPYLRHISAKPDIDSMRRRICLAWPIYRVKSVDGQPESRVQQRTDVDIAFMHAMLGQSTRSYRASITLDLGYQTRVTGPLQSDDQHEETWKKDIRLRILYRRDRRARFHVGLSRLLRRRRSRRDQVGRYLCSVSFESVGFGVHGRS
jgi:hypothetical protein